MNCHKFLPRKSLLSLLLLLVVASLGGSGIVGAHAQSANRFVPVPNAGQPLSAPPLSSTAPIDKNREFTVVLKLADDPVAVVRSRMFHKRLSDANEKAIVARLRSRQDALIPAIQASGVRVMGRFQHALNGIKVRGTAEQIAALSKLPGVVDVKRVERQYLLNAESVPFIGTPAVWAGPPGLHGEHIKVAIIDTGIDYTHANFGGPGTVAAFQTAKATSTLPADPSLFGPDAPKVKGGTDLVGDNYDAGSSDPAKNTPVPDPNPLDCGGHGSHVAGTAAGFGVLADGTTFKGPYDANTPNRSFLIGPGVAPLADIYSVRVFGCSGSTLATVDAIEWAVANHMQVISMSLGSSFGVKGTADSEAATNAVNSGIVVVAASGNAGSIPYITGDPAVADKTISVAAMESHATLPAINFALSTGTSITAFENNPAATVQDGTGLGIFTLRNSDGSLSLGCNESEYVDSLIQGKMVVAMRGTCTFLSRLQFAQNHGAAALTLINNAAGFPTGVTQPFPGIAIPLFTVQGSPSSDGSSLTNASSVTLANTEIPNPTFRSMASFTSSGPRFGDDFLKPDITAPGINIFSTASGTGNQGTVISGTSMATPHVAGVSALALQAHPDWDPDSVRLAIVNTADATQLAGYSAKLAGAGLVQPFPATLTSVVARGNNDAPSLSFGLQEFTADFQGSGDITLTNLGTKPATFNISTIASAGASPHSVEFSPTSITVPGNGTGTVHVALSIAAASNGDSTAFRDVAGVVLFTPATPTDNSGVALHVPYYGVSRARSEVTTTVGQNFGTSNSSTTAQVTNSSGSVPGTADFFAWGLTGTNENLGFFGLRAVGAEAGTDIQGNQIVAFAINTFAPFSYAGAGEQLQINIFLNGHTSPDFEVFTNDLGLATTGTYNGQVIAEICNVAANSCYIDFFASAPNDGSTVILPVYAIDIGLSPGNPRFSYTAVSYSFLNPDYTVSNTLLSDSIAESAGFNAFSPAISTGFGVNVPPQTTFNVGLSINPTEFASTPVQGVMVVSLDNLSGASQAQLIPVSGASVTLESITVAPPSLLVAAGESQPFTATGHYSDNSTQDLTSAVTWTSSDTTVATIDASGVAMGVKAGGPVTITAKQGSVKGTAQLTVTAAVLQSIVIAPASASVPAGNTQAFTATGHYSDSSTQDLTSAVTWTSSDATIVTISASGLATGVKAGGPVTITAQQGSVKGTAQLTVTAAVLQSIVIAPASASVPAGNTQAFTATGHYSDSSTQDLTSAVTWTSSDATIVTISASGVAMGVKAGGPVTITAQQGSVKGTAQLTVTAAVLQSIVIAPASASVPAGNTQAFTATGHYSDSSTQDLTSAVTWSSSDTTIATISAAGLATGVKAGGPLTITAQQGSAKGTAQLTVTANNVSVMVNTSPKGETFSVDGTTYSIAQTFTWVSGSTHSLSTTSPQPGSPGTQFTWMNWSDGGGISHQVTAPSSAITYTANFSTQFQLLTNSSPAGGGSVTPVSGNYYDAGSVVTLTATANAGFTFTGWTGSVANSNSSAITVTMSAPQSVTANFAAVAPATVIDYRVLFGSESYSLLGSARNRLPWQISGIQVVFSKPIAAGDANSLSGVSVTGFSGIGTSTLTWSIQPVVLGNVATALAAAGADALKDATGTATAPFTLNFRVLDGDYNDDGAVSSADMVAVSNARSAPYNIFADLNGDGVVNLTDVQIVRSRIGTTLP